MMQLGSVCSVCNLKMYIITQRAGENIKSRRFVLFPCKKSISCRVGIWSDARCFSVGSNHVPFVMHLLNYTSPHNVKLTQLLLHLYVMPSNRLNQIWTEILIFRYCWQLVTWKFQYPPTNSTYTQLISYRMKIRSRSLLQDNNET